MQPQIKKNKPAWIILPSFQDFYRVIAEMTEEEIVSAISNGTYRGNGGGRAPNLRGTRREKAANEKKIELPEITFSDNYRGGRSNATLVKYLGYIVVDIDHQTQEALARILALAKVCPHPHRFHQPQRNGTENRGTCMPDRRDIARNNSEIEDFHHAAYHKIASFYAQLCRSWRSTLPGRMLAALACSLTIRIFISIPMPSCHRGTATDVLQVSKRRKGHPAKRKRRQHQDNNPLTEQVGLNYHSSHASLMVTLNYITINPKSTS